jgi:VWFA-related protein
MLAIAFFQLRISFAIIVCLCAFLSGAHGQQASVTPEQTEDVLRINADLAQTDVMVFDKQGRFIDNLKPEQFELKIDGKPKPITFFEYLKAGSPNEDLQLSAARGNIRSPSPGQLPGGVVPLDRGRVVIFFVDDLHLAIDSMQRVQTLLKEYFERNFGQNDRAAITTGSGQLGFLEQVTDDRAVLLAAIKRLRASSTTARDYERPPMTEAQALSIARFNPDVTDFFVDRFLADNPGFPRPSAVEFVRKRAVTMLQQTSALTKNSLQSLYNLIRSVGEMPERKLLLFVSDGFLIDDQTSNVSSTLRRITDASARAGVVVYSMDARGLTTGIPDPTMDAGADPGERLTRSSTNEITATQEPLRSLSSDTGGRALLNTNALTSAATVALQETSAYYVLAWRPDPEQDANKFRRIDVSIVGRPELVVRVRRGFLDKDSKPVSPANVGNSGRPSKPQTTDDILLNAIKSRLPLNALPLSVFASFANDKTVGSYVTISMEVDKESLAFTTIGGKESALVDVAGIVYDDRGKPASSFKAQLTINPTGATTTSRPGIAFNHQMPLKPGLYQVRVAASDKHGGRVGSAVQWIEVPDVTLRQLSLSSVTLGERTAVNGASNADSPAPESVFLNVSRRFARASHLRFLTHIYNAQNTGPNDVPDVVIQVQIFRDNQPILTTPLSKVDTQGIPDLSRLPYAADIPLSSMPAGRYRLQVTVIDRISKSTATQNVSFEVG